jgi:hypothetical protein
MAVDRYTKFVLTVIAGCLVWICAMGLPPALHAQQNMTFQNGNGPAVPVVVVGGGMLTRDGKVTVLFHGDRTDPWLPVQLPYTAANPLPASLPYTNANPMPTRLPYTPEAPMPIALTSVHKVTSWEPLRVTVEDAPTRSRPGIGRSER